uniref:SF1B family DNA helicase RecD2 n=1 Tax=Nosocomiicoccus ampullae TaxID=489910 RepID=UPI00211CA703|nr:ATP-dependent RecD-like DNA helicase [Nosocomiicoccus ampullae]
MMTQLTIEDDLFVTGTVDKIIFHNDDNHFYVMRVLIDETNTELKEETIITGNFHHVDEHETYTFTGEIVEHARFGKQFSARQIKKNVPQTKEGIIQYLSGEKFKGVGQKTAENIVNTLGDKTLELILESKSNLDRVNGLTKERKETIYRTVVENESTTRADLMMIELGIAPSKRAKIIDTYKEDILNILQNNPYKLVEDIFGIGFKKADEIAIKAGIEPNSTERIDAGIKYALETELNEVGHTYVELNDLIDLSLNLLNDRSIYFSASDIHKRIDELAEKDELVIRDNKVTLKLFFISERKSAEKVYGLSQLKVESYSHSRIETVISQVEKSLEITFNDEQQKAIKHAILNPISVVTGGPGTGKTTIVSGIIEVYRILHNIDKFIDFEGEEYPIKLAAPTGRAAKRMKDATGIGASTIHRLIGYGRDTEETDILDNIIDADLIIVDEMSMVDTWLFYQFIKNVLPETQIVFVGDDAQLPSVGPGTVFKDLIESQSVPVTILKKIYRQMESSSIIQLAYQINNNLPVNILERHPDRTFFQTDASGIINIVDIVVKGAVKKGYTMQDVQVLAPIYRGPAGINVLNQTIQKVLNPPSEDKKEVEFGDKIYRENDKVIQLENRREDNVFNGDSGIITEITYRDDKTGTKESITVDFLGQEIVYERKDYSELSHAYCTSIHKAQGSEYRIVIMPIVRQYYHMLQKNIIYTGITRAKESLVLCGEPDSFIHAINQEGIERQTMLKTYLKEMFKQTDIKETIEETDNHMLTMELIMQKRIDPMINMSGVSPYDFN